MKRALVLSGGGCKGAFEAGAIDYLVNEAGKDFRIFLGTSVGALNAALLSQARDQRELRQLTGDLKALWLGIKDNSSIYKQDWLGVIKLLLGGTALYRPIGLRRLLEEYIDLKRVFNPASVLKVTTVALESGELCYADSRRPEHQPHFFDYILASASMPLFFPAVPIADQHWYDGGLRDITPLGGVFEEQPDEIVVITTFPLNDTLEPSLAPGKPHGPLATLLRTLDILTKEISANDLRLATAINRNYRAFPGRRYVPVWLIAPDQVLAGADALDFDPVKIRQNFSLGRNMASQPRLLG